MISVIVPVYNVEQYLQECIDSIRGQTETDIEVLLIDDGSTDGSSQICERTVRMDKRFHLIKQANQGLSGARNTGLDHAGGEFISFIDSDDVVRPDFLHYLKRLLTCRENDIAVCNYENLYEDGKTEVPKKLPPDKIGRYSSKKAVLQLLDFHGDFCGHACDKMYRSSFLKNKRFDTSLRCYEDLVFNMNLMTETDRIILGTNIKYEYRMRNGSIMHLKYGENDISALDALKAMYEILQDKGFDTEDIKKAFLLRRFREISNQCGKCIRTLSVREQREYAPMLMTYLEEGKCGIREMRERMSGKDYMKWKLFQNYFYYLTSFSCPKRKKLREGNSVQNEINN